MTTNSLQNKAINGIVWTALQRGGSLVIGFVGNIILARLLAPEDYGCIGILVIFTSLCDILIDGGLGSALIQKKKIQNIDCSTIFVSNLVISASLFILLFIFAPYISEYFHLPILKDVIRIESVTIIIRALYIIPASLASRDLKFKNNSIIAIVSSFISVSISVILAYCGLGVWSLVAKNIILQFSTCILYWTFIKWRISFKFSISSFKSLFKYGVFVALSNLSENLFANIESFIIGRKYSPTTLGFYSQAKSLGQVPIYSISMITSQVLFPTLSKLQDQKENLVRGLRKSIISITYIAFPIIILLCVLSKQVITLLYSEKWLASVPFLQIICITGLVNSLIHSNYSVLKALGSSKLFLFSQIANSSLKLLFLILGMRYGLMGLLCGHAVGSYLGCGVIMHISGRLTGYGLKKQIKDVLPALVLTFLLGILSYYIINVLTLRNILLILVITLIFTVLYILFSKIFHLYGLKVYEGIIMSKFKK